MKSTRSGRLREEDPNPTDIPLEIHDMQETHDTPHVTHATHSTTPAHPLLAPSTTPSQMEAAIIQMTNVHIATQQQLMLTEARRQEAADAREERCFEERSRKETEKELQAIAQAHRDEKESQRDERESRREEREGQREERLLLLINSIHSEMAPSPVP